MEMETTAQTTICLFLYNFASTIEDNKEELLGFSLERLKVERWKGFYISYHLN
jgi:hypothetical protein